MMRYIAPLCILLLFAAAAFALAVLPSIRRRREVVFAEED